MRPDRRMWRVQGVPCSFDNDALADALRCHTDLGCGDAGKDGDNGATVRTLAPNLRHVQNGGQLCLDLQLQSSSLASGDKRDRSSLQTATVTIDDNFDGVTVLYSPTPELHDFDILAVSGLGSHAFGSFVHEQDGHMWLSDSLPRDIPTARVMIYGYKSPLSHSTSFAEPEDLASSLRLALSRILRSGSGKRLLLIGHGLGGLLIKQALIRIFESDTDAGLLEFFVGWLFFGVPNNGMNIDSLLSMVCDQPNRSLHESLRRDNSSFLRAQRVPFERLISQRHFEMFCFYETEQSPTAAEDQSGRFKMNGPPECLVSYSSATSCLPAGAHSDRAVAIHRTHSDLVKFAYSDSEYENVAHILTQIYSRSADTLQTMHDLAGTKTLCDQRKDAEAEAIGREALKLREKVLGAGHASTLQTMHDLADVLYRQGKYAEERQVRKERTMRKTVSS